MPYGPLLYGAVCLRYILTLTLHEARHAQAEAHQDKH